MGKTKTEAIISNLKDEIISKVSPKLKEIKEGTKDVAIAWKKMQDVAGKEIESILKKHLPSSTITIPTSKSAYPDIKIVNREGTFAIDIKANEDSKDPWYDMARLDTMMDDRVNKFIEEWEFVIRFNSETGEFIKAYFCLFREAVGDRKDCKGIKYRPYDGKVRPKTWKEFDENTIHWNTKEKFLEAIEISLKHRWSENIKKHLIPKLNEEEKKAFKKLFD